MKKKPQIYMISVVTVTLITATAILWFLNPLNGFGANQIFPISLRSSFFADYSQDPNRLSENPQEPLNFLEQIIRGIQELIDPDKIELNTQTTEQNIVNPETTMTPENTITPVQTTPAQPGATATGLLNSPTSPSGSNPTQTKTSTTVPTITRTQTTTLTPTLATHTMTPTEILTFPATRTSVVTGIPTHTSIPPTYTFTPVITFIPTQTPVIVQPTWTPSPFVPTQTPVPTGYPAPPTVTVPGYP